MITKNHALLLLKRLGSEPGSAVPAGAVGALSAAGYSKKQIRDRLKRFGFSEEAVATATPNPK